MNDAGWGALSSFADKDGDKQNKADCRHDCRRGVRRNGAVFAEARTRKRSRRRSTIAGRLAAGTSDDRVHDELFLQPPARKLAAAAHRANHAGVHQESLLSVWRKQLRFWE